MELFGCKDRYFKEYVSRNCKTHMAMAEFIFIWKPHEEDMDGDIVRGPSPFQSLGGKNASLAVTFFGGPSPADLPSPILFQANKKEVRLTDGKKNATTPSPFFTIFQFNYYPDFPFNQFCTLINTCKKSCSATPKGLGTFLNLWRMYPCAQQWLAVFRRKVYFAANADT